MNRRTFLALTAVPRVSFGAGVLANDYVVLRRSNDPSRIQVYSPGLARLESGRLVATCDVSTPADLTSKGALLENNKRWTNEIYTSDDHGRTWTLRGEAPMMHARPFEAGNSVYVLGQARDLTIVRSVDRGKTWSAASRLTDGQMWHQAPCNVHYARGRVYLVMEHFLGTSYTGWPVAMMAPVVMSAPLDADLTRRETWTFSSELNFNDAIRQAGAPKLIGTPFFTYGRTAPEGPDYRHMSPIGWLETNVVQFTDPGHVWFDPTGRTFHLWMRAHTGTSNLACIAKAVESEDRKTITVSLEHAPSGEVMLYVPCPGGQMKFHILYDEPTRLYWLLSTQATDSMRRAERLDAERYNLPNNERQRLQLHFSRNCIDWCFAGLVAAGPSQKQSRHYASMAVDGEDLHVLSRSGDHRAASAHNGNFISFHTVKDFRSLVY